MASKYRVAVVMVTHLSKGSKDKAVYRSMGSLAFSAAARAVWHVAKDHDDPDRRLFLLAKMNVCEESTGLAYRLEDGVVCWEEGSVTPGGWKNTNFRTTFSKIIRRTGLESWPRQWHSMRASCETDLARRFTLAVVAKWLGNTQAVAMRHYVDVTDGDFERAINEGDAHAAHKEAQYLSETGVLGGTSKIPKTQKPRKLRGF